MNTHLSIDRPSSWVSRFLSLIASGEVLDLACGGGRHSRLLAARGYRVLALDRDAEALAGLADDGVATMRWDLEAHAQDDVGSAWPFAPGRFQGVVVTNYLHRPLFPYIVDSLAPGGVLIYETFAAGNEEFGKPSNPAFLLQRGELLQLTQPQTGTTMRVVAFEDGYIDQPKPAMVQRICAIKQNDGIPPQRLRLI